MNKKPIFIVGTPRSGTTLTARILGLHPNLFMPGETHYFDDIVSRSKQLGNPTKAISLARIAERLYTIYDRYYEYNDQKRIENIFHGYADLKSALNGCSDYACIFDRFMTLQMEAVSKRRWGNNTPRDIFNYRKIREYYPGAKFIICVRDIRAFLLSYKWKWKVVNGECHINRLKKLYHPVITSYLWKTSMRQAGNIEKEIPATDRVIVRYEDLVSSPETTIRKICETIEESFDPSMLQVTTHNSSAEQQEDGIFSTSIERWRTELSPEEISIGQNIAKRQLSWLGYPHVDVSPSVVNLLKIWLVTPVTLWKAIRANKAITGPLIPYLAKRIAALLGVGS